MSISFCKECDRVVEGETIECEDCGAEICVTCGRVAAGLPEDDPREER